MRNGKRESVLNVKVSPSLASPDSSSDTWNASIQHQLSTRQDCTASVRRGFNGYLASQSRDNGAKMRSAGLGDLEPTDDYGIHPATG